MEVLERGAKTTTTTEEGVALPMMPQRCPNTIEGDFASELGI